MNSAEKQAATTQPKSMGRDHSMTAALGHYADLALEPGPSPLLEALKLFGTAEIPGPANNQTILAWARELGPPTPALYVVDSTPWCGLFCGIVMKRAGFTPPRLLVRARAWMEFGSAVTEPLLGDVVVFTRDKGGHVGLYVGEDNEAFHVLGGNQGDRVSIIRRLRNRLVGARRPIYPATPQTIRAIWRLPEGGINSALA